MLSIIIPTLNEEDYLSSLLESIKKQAFGDYEIIISDAGSTDATLEIARKYHCVVTGGGLPAVGRNNGAKIAKGEVLFFLDADTILPENFLHKSLAEFNVRKLDFASFCITPYPYKFFAGFFIELFYNKMIVVMEKILAHSAVGILVKKEVFEKLGGYDEDIKLSEDHDLGRRATKISKFGIIRSARIIVSDRRAQKDGWLATGVRYFLCELYTIFSGPVKSDIFKYKFNHYKEKK